MSDQSLHDTATDLIIPAADRRPWFLPEAVWWAGATAMAADGIWWATLYVWQSLAGPVSLDSHLAGGLFGTAAICAAIAGFYGLLVGAAAGFIYGRSPRPRSTALWAVGFAVAAAVGGGLVPLAVAIAPSSVVPPVSSGVAWAVVGALVGIAGYAQNRYPVTDYGADGTWCLARAAGWGLAVGTLAAGVWLGVLAVLRVLPDPVLLGLLVRGNELALGLQFAVLAAGVGLVVGSLSGLAFGAPSRQRAALVRGFGYLAIGALGGGLVPLVVAVTVDWMPAEVSSALTWGGVCGIAGVVVALWTRLPRPEGDPGGDANGGTEAVGRRPEPVRASSVPPPAEPARVTGAWVHPTAEDQSPVLTADWDTEPVAARGPEHQPRIVPANRTLTSGAVIRVAPVLMVTVVCLLAVGLSAPSPVGWAMLAVGLLGLATAAALVGQERRIRELGRRLGGPTS